MDKGKNYLTRTYWQLGLVLAVVIVIGLYRNGKAINAEKEDDPLISEFSLPDRLEPAVAFDDTYEIPDLVFGTDKNWENFPITDIDETILLKGTGHIDGQNVSVKCRYNLIDGNMTGRYYHENGTTLDLNGQVYPSGNELEIHLGHKSNNTFSIWILHPEEKETESGTYAYNGYWGKSKKPSDITFKVIE